MKIAIETRWIEPKLLPVPPELQLLVGQSPLLAQGLLRQGMSTPDQVSAFLDPNNYEPSDSFDLPDMEKSVSRLLRAIEDHERIGVWGDFDVDGQTSTTLFVSTLRALGADVSYHIPVRAKEGHGIRLPSLETFLQDQISLVLSCDTGIDAHDAVEFARQRGVDFVITDHHSLPSELPDACAVVNPLRLPANHPARTLSGVGAAYKLVEALCRRMGKPEIAIQGLDLAALGLVADVAELTGDARYMVQLGLERLRNTTRPGLNKMFELAEVNPVNLSEQHIGFVIAPRLNAIGRLSDANPMVDFLTSDDPQVISVLAVRLEGMNGERRFLSEQVFQGALQLIERSPSVLELPALVLTHPDWPAGVVGPVANRLVELVQKPVILLSSPPDEPARGSARSIEGVNITEAIASGSEFLLGYGGHPMAAGLSVKPQNLPAFQQRLNDSIRRQTGDRPPVKEIQIDAYLELSQINLELIEQINPLAPFGAGNPALSFASKNVHIADFSPIGKTGEHLQILIEDDKGGTRRLIWWQGSQSLLPEGKFDVAYTLRSSNYRGQNEVQMEWVDGRQTPEAVIELAERHRFDIHDLRAERDPISGLAAYIKGSCILWQEGKKIHPSGVDRTRLQPAETLIILNPPPGQIELRDALRACQPKTVVLCALPAGNDQLTDYIKTFSGMLRYALNKKKGLVEVDSLAAALNQRTSAVEAGLRWLAARGFVRIVSEAFRQFELAEGGIPDDEVAGLMESALRSILHETAAFRTFYTHTDPKALLEIHDR